MTANDPKNAKVTTTLHECRKGNHHRCVGEVKTVGDNTWICDCPHHANETKAVA